MPQQLIYTSAPRGIIAGRSGHCTVARSASMREALMLQLEKFCYYQHLSLSGGQERPIFACRIVDIRGSRFHVLTRIQDAGLDFTGRTNFIAHHLVFTPEEIRQNASPPVILRHWPGWMKLWTTEPQLFESEDWSGLGALASRVNVPAESWHLVTGDAVNGYGLLEMRNGASFRVDDQSDETVLELIAESLELLEVRDTRKDFRATAWQYTFTTSIQEQDNPADFRWRCIHSDNPAAIRFATPDCRALSAVRVAKCSGEETIFAREGRQAPRLVAEPNDLRITEGEAAHFTAKAEGVPRPAYQWFSVDRANNGQVLAGETNPELVLSNATLGVARYVVRVSNGIGNVQSRVATLSVEPKLKLASVRPDTISRNPAKPPLYAVRTAEEIERQQRRLGAEKAEEVFYRKQRRKKVLKVTSVALIAALTVSAFVLRQQHLLLFSQKIIAPTNSNSSPSGMHPSPGPQRDPVSENQSNSTGVSAATSDKRQPHTEPTGRPQPREEFPLPEGWTKIAIGNVTNVKAEFIQDKSRFDLYATLTTSFTNGDNVLFACRTNTGGEFLAVLKKIDPPSGFSVAGIMMRESLETNSPFLFIGASSEKILVYRSDGKDQFTNQTIAAQAPLRHGVTLAFQQTNKMVIPAYGSDSSKLHSCEDFAEPEGQKLVGLALFSGTFSNKMTAQFQPVIIR